MTTTVGVGPSDLRATMSDVARPDVQTPIVGRAAELDVLTRALDAAGRGEPGAVLVAGDAGVGKTRLLSEFTARAQSGGATVLVGHCLDVGGVGLPYLPFTEALRPLTTPERDGDSRGGWDVDWRTVGAPGADVGQLQLFDAVAGLLSAAGTDRQGPVLLVLEDLHWADQSTRDLVAFLLARMREERLLVVASYRSDDLHRRHPLRAMLAELVRLATVERLEVRPFDAAQMTRFLHHLRGAAVPATTVRQILDRSEGNAYYAQELLDSCDTHNGAGASGHGEPLALPPALADVLLARIENLPALVQQVARAASVAGRRVSHALLRRACGLDDSDLEQALREAVVSHVLVPDGRDSYAFRHALLQEAVYGDLLPGERVRLHATYAKAVDEAGTTSTPLGSAALLAHHRMQSHDVPGALSASVRAAEEAEALHAPAEAWQHLEQALRLWDAVADPEERAGTDLIRLTLRAAGMASRAGELARAAALARSALDHVDPSADAALAAAAQHKLALHLLGVDEPAEALDAALEAIRLSTSTVDSGDGEPTPVGVWGAATAARALFYQDRYDEARRYAEQAREGAVRLEIPGAEADALVSLAGLDNLAGRHEAVSGLFTCAVDRARQAGDLPTEMRASYNLAADRYDAGDVRGALALLDAAVERCVATGLTWSVYGLELRALQVTALFVAGDWTASAQAARLAGSRPPDAMVARLSAAGLHVAVARGDDAAGAAVRQLEGAWHHDAMIALVSGGCAAELLRWQADPSGALDVVHRVLRYVDDAWWPWYLAGIWLSAVGLGAAGDLAERARLTRDDAAGRSAREAGDRLLERARATAREGRPRGGTLGPEGSAWLARAEAEHARVRGAADIEAWQGAFDEFGYGHAYEQARCRWRLAECLLAQDKRDDAGAVLRQAHAAAVHLGANPLRTELEALARRGRLDLGAPGGPGGTAGTGRTKAARSDEAVLTPREREVLILLSEGRTNRQIGAELFIAEKTASVHVSNILAKLGVGSRTEAVTVAHRRGLLSAGLPFVQPGST